MSGDDAVPVTIVLTAPQAERLEALVERLRGEGDIDENDLCDGLFALGILAFEAILESVE